MYRSVCVKRDTFTHKHKERDKEKKYRKIG